MPLFMCRWENGDCSFVAAPNRKAGIEYLDEIGNADGSRLTTIRDFIVHFELTPKGKLRFHTFGELAQRAIYEKAYPLLDELLHSGRLTDPAAPTARDRAEIRAMVAKEQERLLGKKRRKLPKTGIGRAIAKDMDVPASLADRMVRHVAEEKLKTFHPHGKPH